MDEKDKAKTVIGDDIEIVGSVKCASSIRLEGKLNGDLTCTGTATIGNTASVKGNISADVAMIIGHVQGNISAKDMIQLKSPANITGDIRAKRLSVDDGVTFVGKAEVNPSGAPSKPYGQEGGPEVSEKGGLQGKK